MSVEALSGKVFLLITGASRGIGRQVAITFGSILEEGSHMLLLARSKEGLQEVASKISSKVKVHIVSTDLSKTTDVGFKEFISEALKGTTANTFDRVILVHNVGFIDTFSVANEILDVNFWRQFYDVNFFVPAILNAVFMNMFDDKTINFLKHGGKKMIINISSISAVQPFIRCSTLCSAEAAKEMYLKVFALENPDVDVLNYAPGTVETDMFNTFISKLSVDPQCKKMIKDVMENNPVLTTEQTVNRLVQVINEHKYKSADHVDYYEEL